MPKRFELAKSISIEGRKIGAGKPVFVIAEIGINHNGDPVLAKKMIDAAKKCGADCVKFQTFRAEEFLSDRKMIYAYKRKGKIVKENMFDMFKRTEFDQKTYESLFRYARKRGLVPLTSVADPESVDMIAKLGAAAFKLSSEDLINLPLVEYALKKRKPVIFSTGMADEQEIDDLLKLLKKYNVKKAVFLHCVSQYPCADDQAHLLRIPALANKTKGLVGYSDHTAGIAAAVGAVALGAAVIEKHFTLDKKLPGPDQEFSADPSEFCALVGEIRRMEDMKGKESLAYSSQEKKSRAMFRRSIVAARDLPKGHVLKRQDMALKRPGKGLRGREIPRLVGKVLKQDVGCDQIIMDRMIKQ